MTNRLSNPRPPIVEAFTNSALTRIIKRAGPIHQAYVKEGVKSVLKEVASPVSDDVAPLIRKNVEFFLNEIIEKALQFSVYKRLKDKTPEKIEEDSGKKGMQFRITTECILEALKLSRYNINLICGTEDFVGPKMIKMSGGVASSVRKPQHKSDGKFMKMEDLDKNIRLLKAYNQHLLPWDSLYRLIKIKAQRILKRMNLEAKISITDTARQTLLLLLQQFITSLSTDAWSVCKHDKKVKLQPSHVELAIEIKKYYK